MLQLLSIPKHIVDSMVDHARSDAPLEACGLLSGTGARVHDIHKMTNADHSAEHFSLLPEEQFAHSKAIRARGHKILAVYHSHPASPARPSDEDRRLAFAPDIVHIIISLANPRQAVVKGFLLDGPRVSSVSLSIDAPAVTSASHEEQS